MRRWPGGFMEDDVVFLKGTGPAGDWILPADVLGRSSACPPGKVPIGTPARQSPGYPVARIRMVYPHELVLVERQGACHVCARRALLFFAEVSANAEGHRLFGQGLCRRCLDTVADVHLALRDGQE